MEKTEIVNLIHEELQSKSKFLTDIGIRNYKEFTNQLKIIIGDLGEKMGYEVATNCDKEYNEKEWLFDLVWYKMAVNENENIVSSIDLVLESEISYKTFGHFKIDFDKLLIATKSTKIMIFTKVKEQLIERIKNYVQSSLNISNDYTKDNKIHLILWDENDTGEFYLTSFTKL
ncbi:hypothetical protein [Polaribacter sp. Z022]|uniref:hypothetical protein n=1 Tax=Polaribacter sp. Z022 TaxID=2927125 RepID=UPI000C15EDF4|nr:hypothetical protein [Polaribacter sp. Z022]MCL7755127.1 hypothetical protein [Polaribacter sp. Z022]PIB37645.1 hypothetical protein BFP78_00200 [Gaetbulibacter sp. 5U11]